MIPADNKWYRNFAVASIVLETLEQMNPALPQPKVDLNAIRKKFNLAVLQEAKGSLQKPPRAQAKKKP